MNFRSFGFFYYTSGEGAVSSFDWADVEVGFSSFLEAYFSALRMALISEVALTSMYYILSSSSSSVSIRFGLSASLIYIKDLVDLKGIKLISESYL